MPFVATWMNLEMIILSKADQRKTNIIGYHFYVDSKKIQMNLSTKQNQRLQKQSYSYQRRMMRQSGKLGV